MKDLEFVILLAWRTTSRVKSGRTPWTPTFSTNQWAALSSGANGPKTYRQPAKGKDGDNLVWKMEYHGWQINGSNRDSSIQAESKKTHTHSLAPLL